MTSRPNRVSTRSALPEVCGFLSFDELTTKAERSLGIAKSLKPNFLQEIAEVFTDDAEE